MWSTVEPQTSTILAITESYFNLIHSSIGIPWWTSIIIGAIGLRTLITLPLSLYQQKRLHKAILLTPLLESWSTIIQNQVKKESPSISFTLAEKEYKWRYREKVKSIYKEYNCDPLTTRLLPFIQIPLFWISSLTLRGMADASSNTFAGLNLPSPVDSFHYEGIGWFMDLTMVDSTMTLPIAFGLINLFNIELHNLFLKRIQKIPTRGQLILMNISRVLCLVFIPVASQAPIALCLYWTTSSIYSILQNIAFQKFIHPPKRAKDVLEIV